MFKIGDKVVNKRTGEVGEIQVIFNVGYNSLGGEKMATIKLKHSTTNVMLDECAPYDKEIEVLKKLSEWF